MPWLSPLPSPVESPHLQTLASPSTSSPITYIPPLIDGACGTVPRAQKQPFSQTLGSDVASLVKLLPELALSVREGLFTNENTATGEESLGSRWREFADLVLQLALSAVELNMLFLAIPLWLVFPGVFFAGWLLPMFCVAWAIARLLNTREPIYRQPRPPQADVVGTASSNEEEDERWFFLAGMSLSPCTTKLTTLPLLARLFNRPITALLPRTYGLPLDLLLILLTRALPYLSPNRMLYSSIRSALQDNKASKVIILAHNTGAIHAARVLSYLHADLPPDKLSKLEVYTFGAVATEFVLPLGDGRAAAEASGASSPSGPLRNPRGTAATVAAAEAATTTGPPHATTAPSDTIDVRRPSPHVEHFAHAGDPFARMGVLRSVREDLDGRFCGGVFVVNGTAPALGESRAGRRMRSPHGLDAGTTAALPPPSSYLSPLGVSSSVAREADFASARRTAAPARAWGTMFLSSFPLVGRLAGWVPCAPPVVSLHAYLATLFPEQVATLANCDRASVLDSIMTIDRDMAEKREFAAIASHASSTSLAIMQSFPAGNSSSISSISSKINRRDKRISWTGLGATVNGINGSGGSSTTTNSHLDGIIGLEIARQGCRNCQGHRGREVSRLVRFVNVGVGLGSAAAAAVEGGVGFDGPTGGSGVVVKDIPKTPM